MCLPQFFFRTLVEKSCIAELSCYNFSKIAVTIRLQIWLPLLFQNFKEHPVIEGKVEEACTAEVSCYNPRIPATKLFTSVISELQSHP